MKVSRLTSLGAERRRELEVARLNPLSPRVVPPLFIPCHACSEYLAILRPTPQVNGPRVLMSEPGLEFLGAATPSSAQTSTSIRGPGFLVDATRLFRWGVDTRFFHTQVTLCDNATDSSYHTTPSRKVFRVSKANFILVLLVSLLLPHRYRILIHFHYARAAGSCMRGSMSRTQPEARLICVGSSKTGFSFLIFLAVIQPPMSPYQGIPRKHQSTPSVVLRHEDALFFSFVIDLSGKTIPTCSSEFSSAGSSAYLCKSGHLVQI